MKFSGSVVVGIAKLKVVWQAWDVRSFIVASFLFQVFLIIISPLRKRTSNLYIRVATWIAYLLADWVAAQAVGLIARATHVSNDAESDLFGLWAQFLLLHLGGPDTITALALEDNELWIRTALHLGTQAYATLGILVRSVRQSTLWIATVLMFFAGVIKYLERVTSLNFGRLSDIEDDPYQEYMTKLSIEDWEDEEEKKPLSNEAMVRGSYWLFQAYKSLYSDIQLKPQARAASRKFFLKRRADEAYRMVDIQLNLTYEAMYTKMGIIHRTSWRALRHVVLFLQVTSFVIWYLWDKQHFQIYDVGVTYVLLVGAIAVDLVGFMRVRLSDWNVALRKHKSSSNKILSTCDLVTCNASRACRDMWSRLENAHLSRNRWSMHIGYYGGLPTTTSSKNLLDKLHLTNVVHNRGQVKFDCEISNKWCFIFEMLTKPNDQSYKLPGSVVTLNMSELMLRALPIHILDYNFIFQFWLTVTLGKDGEGSSWGSIEICRDLLRYLIYLMCFQPDMMYAAAGKSVVVGLQKKAIDGIRSELRSVPIRNVVFRSEEEGAGDVADQNEDIVVVSETTEVQSSFGFGLLSLESNRSFATYDDAIRQMVEVQECVLAEHKWEVIERVWVELVCYAAITCRPSVHAAKLKQGSEFLTFVWMLMLHLGIEARTYSREGCALSC